MTDWLPDPFAGERQDALISLMFPWGAQGVGQRLPVRRDMGRSQGRVRRPGKEGGKEGEEGRKAQQDRAGFLPGQEAGL